MMKNNLMHYEWVIAELLEICMREHLVSNRQVGELWNSMKGQSTCQLWRLFHDCISRYYDGDWRIIDDPGIPEEDERTPGHIEDAFHGLFCNSHDTEEAALGSALLTALHNGPSDDGSVDTAAPGTP